MVSGASVIGFGDGWEAWAGANDCTISSKSVQQSNEMIVNRRILPCAKTCIMLFTLVITQRVFDLKEQFKRIIINRSDEDSALYYHMKDK